MPRPDLRRAPAISHRLAETNSGHGAPRPELASVSGLEITISADAVGQWLGRSRRARCAGARSESTRRGVTRARRRINIRLCCGFHGECTSGSRSLFCCFPRFPSHSSRAVARASTSSRTDREKFPAHVARAACVRRYFPTEGHFAPMDNRRAAASASMSPPILETAACAARCVRTARRAAPVLARPSRARRRNRRARARAPTPAPITTIAEPAATPVARHKRASVGRVSARRRGKRRVATAACSRARTPAIAANVGSPVRPVRPAPTALAPAPTERSSAAASAVRS